MVYVSQLIVLHTLNLYSAVCQLNLDKAGRKKKIRMNETFIWAWVKTIMTWICSKKVNHQRFQSFEREEIGYGFLNKGKEYIYTHTHIHIHTHIKARVLSHVQLFVTPWTVAHQGPLSMRLS